MKTYEELFDNVPVIETPEPVKEPVKESVVNEEICSDDEDELMATKVSPVPKYHFSKERKDLVAAIVKEYEAAEKTKEAWPRNYDHVVVKIRVFTHPQFEFHNADELKSTLMSRNMSVFELKNLAHDLGVLKGDDGKRVKEDVKGTPEPKDSADELKESSIEEAKKKEKKSSDETLDLGDIEMKGTVDQNVAKLQKMKIDLDTEKVMGLIRSQMLRAHREQNHVAYDKLRDLMNEASRKRSNEFMEELMGDVMKESK